MKNITQVGFNHMTIYIHVQHWIRCILFLDYKPGEVPKYTLTQYFLGSYNIND